LDLRQLCKAYGKTLKQVSEDSEISRDYLSKLNKRKKDNPSADILEKISLATGASTDEVIKAIRG
jgi:transcriptional regulator with XRE-family HTH domain